MSSCTALAHCSTHIQMKQMLIWRIMKNRCHRFIHQRVARGKDTGWVHDFRHYNELQPLCLCMYNYVWIMLQNRVGTSHCGTLCCQSLCFHIWQELWSGRWAIYMLHTYTHCHRHSGKIRDRDRPLLATTKTIDITILVFRDRFWYGVMKFTYLMLREASKNNRKQP